MFCGNCGIKIEDGAEFCQSCGTKTESFGRPRKINESKESVLESTSFYSEDWMRAKYFAVSSLPYFDILVTKDNLYLIQFPKTHGGTIGLILGLFLFNILGAIIGTIIGNSSDRNKRKNYRATWINIDHRIISKEYQNNIFLKIPKDNLKNVISFKKNKFVVIANGDETITLKKNKIEYEKFNKFIKSYVL